MVGVRGDFGDAARCWVDAAVATPGLRPEPRDMGRLSAARASSTLELLVPEVEEDEASSRRNWVV